MHNYLYVHILNGFGFINGNLRLQNVRRSSPRGGDSHMKQTGMLVVSLRGVNFGFWSCLRCSGQSANILSRQGLVQGSAKNLRFMTMLLKTTLDKSIRWLCLYIIKTHCISYLCVFKWSLLGVKICLSHAQIGLL